MFAKQAICGRVEMYHRTKSGMNLAVYGTSASIFTQSIDLYATFTKAD